MRRRVRPRSTDLASPRPGGPASGRWWGVGVVFPGALRLIGLKSVALEVLRRGDPGCDGLRGLPQPALLPLLGGLLGLPHLALPFENGRPALPRHNHFPPHAIPGDEAPPGAWYTPRGPTPASSSRARLREPRGGCILHALPVAVTGPAVSIGKGSPGQGLAPWLAPAPGRGDSGAGCRPGGSVRRYPRPRPGPPRRGPRS
jgi:hypothetical protein